MSNGGYALNLAAGHVNSCIENNAYYNNTSGLYGTLTNTGVNDITLTADPFTAVGSEDFTLNNTAGGGSALKSLAVPTTLPFGVTTTNFNIGVSQNAYSVGGSSGLRSYGSA